MKKDTEELLLLLGGFVIFIIICIILGQLFSYSREKKDNICIQKMNTIEDLKGCEYLKGNYERIGFNLIECQCVKDSRIQRFVAKVPE